MKEIKSLIILCVLFFIGACVDVKVESESSLVVGFKEKNPMFYENSALNSILVSLSVPAPYDISVGVQVRAEENIQEGKDYLLHSKNITIEKGRNYANIELEFIDDKIVNGSRSFELVLIPQIGVAVDLENAVCKVTLLDDENDVGVMFEEPVFSCREDAGEVLIPLLQEGPQNSDVKIWVSVKDIPQANPAIEGVHFKLLDTTILLLKESSRDNLGVRIAPLADNEISQDRTFVLEIIKVFGGMKIVSKSTCVVTIRNIDLGIWFSTTELAVEENPSSAESLKTVLRFTGNSEEDLKVKVEADGGTAQESVHFIIPQKELVVPAGTDSIEIEVIPLYDENITGDVDFRLKVAEIVDHPEVNLAGVNCGITLYDYDTDLSFNLPTSGTGVGVNKTKIAVSLSHPVRHPLSFSVIKGTATNLNDNDFELPEGNINIPAGITDTVFSVDLLNSKEGYLDLKLKAVAGIAASHVSNDDHRLKIVAPFDYGTVDRSQIWTVVAYSTQASGSEVVKMLQNGDPTSSYWHNAWSGTEAPLPHWAILDLGEIMGISSVYGLRRVNATYGDTRTVELYISNTAKTEDDPDWTYFGTLNFGDNKSSLAISDHEASLYVIPDEVTGRYLKLKVTESNRTTGTKSTSAIAKFSIEGYSIQ